MGTYTCTITGDEELGFDLMVTGTQYRVGTFRSYFEANAARMVAGNVRALDALRAALEMDARLTLCGFYTVN